MGKWRTKTIREVTSLIKDGTHGTHKEDMDGVPLLSAKDINNGRVVFDNSPRLISKSDFKSIHKGYQLQDNDVLLTIVGSLGRVAMIENYSDNFTFQRSVAILRFKDEVVPKYMYHALTDWRFQKELMKRESKGAQGGVYLGEIAKIKLDLPEKPEQERIVSVLEVWDEYLELLDRKIALKEELKRGLMQLLLVGKHRLPGFNDQWSSITLGDVGKVSMCKRIFNNQTAIRGDVPFYKIGTFGKQPNAFITQKIYDEYRHKFSFPSKGDILISASGTIGRTVVYDGKPAYFQDSNIIWIANNEKKILNRFLYYQYKFVKWNTASGTIARLYNDNVRRVKITVPSIDEQAQIANILQSCDRALRLISKKRDDLLEQKKYLLKNLISGKIRTPENLGKRGAN